MASRAPCKCSAAESLDDVVARARSCNHCASILPHAPRPVFRVHADARILVAAQAPGMRVHRTGIPFNDPSGDRLRRWMGIERATFYSPSIALLPMAFCFPGSSKSGDLPPPKDCAQIWRSRLLVHLDKIELTILCGSYAVDWHLSALQLTLSEAVARWRELPAGVIATPHPSGRNNGWLKRRPWFESELVPELRRKVALALKSVPQHRLSRLHQEGRHSVSQWAGPT